MTISQNELKAKRLKAMAVLGTEMQASADMFDRVIAAGAKVSAARDAAETAHMTALAAQVADLNEMADDLVKMGNVAGGSAGAALSTDTTKPAVAKSSPALEALNAAQPNPNGQGWEKGDAYDGTHPQTSKSSASS